MHYEILPPGGEYKYRLRESVSAPTRCRGYRARIECVSIHPSGLITLEKGFCWDGPSGPAIDTIDFHRGAAVHDGLYRLISCGKLPESARKCADDTLFMICKKDGMPLWRRVYAWLAVRAFGGFHC